ncbi:P-loop NTPase [Vibrio coralliilyticus]|uniref:AAA family ATPase n=1 Tax=Vibrio coralliilyticus TaxID=190893 RepID=UPI00148E2DE1|nr:P-loop NTPase [Vibrio coralliilyticus]NOH53530.1 P-loop NTPase [Vibrio coralliilyticus]
MTPLNQMTVLVAGSVYLDSYHLNLAFAEKGITHLSQVSLDTEEVIKAAVKENASVIVLDAIGRSIDEVEEQIHHIIHRTGSKVVVVGDNENIAFYRNVIASGAAEYLINPVDVDSLKNVDLSPVNHSNNTGKVIAVVGTKGGVGASTIVSNLACSLVRSNHSVAVADMDFAAGDLDLQFDVQGNTALVEMLQYPERLEPVVYERSGIQTEPRLTLFTGYLPLDREPFWPEKNALDHFKKFCLQHADNLVLDVPAFSTRDQVGISAIRNADVRVIVVEPTLASIRNAGQLLALLEVGSAGNEKKNVIVLNHTKSNRASLITESDVNRSLGAHVDVSIPFEPKHFLLKDSLGKPALTGNRKVAKAFATLTSLAVGNNDIRASKFWKRGA